MDKDSLTLLLAQGVSVEQIGRRFGKHPSTISYWMNKFGLVAPNREKHLAKGGIERERLEELVAQDMTIAEIAETVGLGKAAVRHWLRRYGLRTARARRTPERRAARAAGKLTTTLTCRKHGETEFILEGRGYYRCKRCRNDGVRNHRRRLKSTLVAEAGGCCCICGYDRHLSALEFHHVDPSNKLLAISQNGATLSLEALRAEAQKCILVCSNCHAELEAGGVQVPASLRPGTAQDSAH